MKILFQGDSITDMGRKYEDAHDLGFGYPKYAAELIAKRHPETDFEFLDLGISGNKVSDLIARLQKDFIDTEADIVSVLIGVNDTWHRANDRNWLDNKTFEAQLREVYGAIKEKMGAKLIVLEQFLIPSEDKDWFREDLDPKIQVVRALAREYADVFIPVDGLLAAAYIGNDPLRFAEDGVHPTPYGAEFIGGLYADAVDKLLK